MATTGNPMSTRTSTPPSSEGLVGAWNQEEQFQFAEGVVLHGWGNWNCMAKSIIPTRDRFQIKSHAQKFRRSNPEIVKELILNHEFHRKCQESNAKKKAGRRPSSSSLSSSSSLAATAVAAPPRRRSSMIKAKTPTLAKATPPRQPRRFSAPGKIDLSRASGSGNNNASSTTPAKISSFTIARSSARKMNAVELLESSPPSPVAVVVAAVASSSQPSTPDSVVSDITAIISDMQRATLDQFSATATTTPFLFPTADLSDFFLSPPSSVHHHHSTPSNVQKLPHEDSSPITKDDEFLSTLAATITFDSDTSYDKLVIDALGLQEGDDGGDLIKIHDGGVGHALLKADSTTIDYHPGGSTPIGKEEAMMDPLLHLEAEDLDMMNFDL